MSMQYFVVRLLVLLMPFWIKICDGQSAWNETYAPWLGCMTPDGGEGRCLVWQRCEYLNQRLRTFDEIEPHRCGLSGSVVMVCCPLTPGNNESEFTDTRLGINSYDCGIRSSENGRIVGGHIAEKGSWPWMATIFHLSSNGSKSYKCGGVLVTSTDVLTVVHCLMKNDSNIFVEPTEILVRLGAHDLTNDNETGAVDIYVTSFKIHELYDHRLLTNDIAILRLNQRVMSSDSIVPVCLPYGRLRYTDIEGKMAFVTGWGVWNAKGNYSNILMEVSFRIQNQDQCKAIFQRNLYSITAGQLCAGTLDGSKDSCEGDSGSPLVIMEDEGDGVGGRYYLVGLVSFGVKEGCIGCKLCALYGYYGVYTRITEYLFWLSLNLPH